MGSICKGGTSVNSIYKGSTEIKEVYKGSTLIWRKYNSISLSSYSSSRTSSSGYFDVTVTSDVNWSASIISGSWVSLSANTGVSGASVRITYTTNSSVINTRSAVIRFSAGNASVDMNLTQACSSAYFTINSTSFTFQSDGTCEGQAYVTPSISTNIPQSYWTTYGATPDWISYNSSTNILDVTAVTTIQSYSRRNGTIEIGATINGTKYSGTIYIVQNLPTDQSSLTVTYYDGSEISPSGLSVGPAGNTFDPWHIKAIAKDAWGSSNTYSVAVSAASEITGLYFKRNDESTWVQNSISNIPSGTIVDIKVESTQSTTNRSTTMYISSGSHTYELLITQTAISPSISISPTSSTQTSSSNTVSVGVTSNMSWTATTSDSWITLTTSSGSSGTTTAQFTISANDSTSSRTGTIRYKINDSYYSDYTITQNGRATSYHYLWLPRYQNNTGYAEQSGTIELKFNNIVLQSCEFTIPSYHQFDFVEFDFEFPVLLTSLTAVLYDSNSQAIHTDTVTFTESSGVYRGSPTIINF